MFYVRKTKTSSGATAIQVVRYQYRKMIVCRHIGSSHDSNKVKLLQQQAKDWIENENKSQLALFPVLPKPNGTILQLDKSQYLGVRYTFLYEVLASQLQFFNFNGLNNQLLFDLVLIRIVEPVSKIASIKLLSQLFGINYQRGHLYETIADFSDLKDTVESYVVQIAKKKFEFDFSVVFYDVTTLYVESFTEDEDTVDEDGNVIKFGLRKNGFSKDNKLNQPQIVIGLMVNKNGFPVSYEIFEGNTFEGDTFIPAITAFKKKYSIETLTVVADAAMISLDNISKLKDKHLSYIVGARIANLKQAQIQEVSRILTGGIDGKELEKRDRMSCRIETDKGSLVCDFSFKRYRKDKLEMEKQIARAQKLVDKNTDSKRAKFLKLKKSKQKKVYEVNNALIDKTRLVLGIKGYYTNLFKENSPVTNQDIIDQYHNLWHVEKAFRIAKSDLAMRPIYHFNRKTIEGHILLCFMALAVSKYMETKTNKSIRKIIDLLKNITDARIKNLLTEEIIIMREKISDEVKQLWKNLESF